MNSNTCVQANQTSNTILVPSQPDFSLPLNINSKTITSTSNTNSSTTLTIQLQSNGNNKRKLKEYDIETNHNEPNRKKRKFNALHSDQLSQNRNSELQKEIDQYKMEANDWKSKYMQLYTKLSQMTSLETMDLDTNNTNTNGNTNMNGNCNGNAHTTQMPNLNGNTHIVQQPKIPPIPLPFIHVLKQQKHTVMPTILPFQTTKLNIGPSLLPMNSHSHTNNRNNINYTNSKENTDSKYDSIRDRLLEMGFDRDKVIKRVGMYADCGETDDYVFNQCINSFMDSPIKLRRLRSDSKKSSPTIKKQKFSDSEASSDDAHLTMQSAEFVRLEQSYYVSVKCHICKKHFDNIDTYKGHLEQHYHTDPTKTWKQCDFCRKELFERDSFRFIRHLATHTKDRPYKCKVMINGSPCTQTMGYKASLKQHWQNHFESKKHRFINTDDSADSESESDSESSFTIKGNGKISNNAVFVPFERSYHVSVHCHVCNEHFDEIQKYRTHIKKHYNTDPKRTWKVCDFGCVNPKKPKWKGDDISFIGHIATHTNCKPFKCDVLTDGTKCGATLTRKTYIREHWRRHFPDQSMDYTPVIKTIKSDKSAENGGEYETVKTSKRRKKKGEGKYVDFEDSYHINVHCHVCNEQFTEDLYDYRDHLEKHYSLDPTKQWRRCDFGCKIDPKKPLFNDAIDFMAHIASQHTKEKPFHCDVIMGDGTNCGSKLCRQSDLRAHWRRHFNIPSSYTNKNILTRRGKRNSKKRKKRVVRNSKNKKRVQKAVRRDVNPNIFEQSYYISVHCHLCKKLFDNFNEYKKHIREHYRIDPLRTWLKCDFGCTVDPNKPLYASANSFLNHLSSHTKDNPYKCGIHKCRNSAGIKSDIKRHWMKDHQKKSKNNESSSSESEYDSSESGSSTSASESESFSESENQKGSSCEYDDKKEMIDFENSYIFDMKCHVCATHFNDFNQLKEHIKEHYTMDTNRQWLSCDFGCKNRKNSNISAVSSNSNNFIAHLAMHSKQKPFKCMLFTGGGEKCPRASTTRGDMRNHWKLQHYKHDNGNEKQKQKMNC